MRKTFFFIRFVSQLLCSLRYVSKYFCKLLGDIILSVCLVRGFVVAFANLYTIFTQSDAALKLSPHLWMC